MHMYVHMLVFMCVHTCILVFICVYACLYVCACVYAYVYMLCPCMLLFVCMRMGAWLFKGKGTILLSLIYLVLITVHLMPLICLMFYSLFSWEVFGIGSPILWTRKWNVDSSKLPSAH